MMTISVVIPARNASLYIVECLDSIFSQSYLPIEVIVIDDASTDDTLAILKAYKKKKGLLKIIENNQNIGIAKSTNLGIECAIGNMIALIDADDVAINDRFKTQIQLFNENAHIDVCGTWLCFFDTEKTYQNIWRTPINDEDIKAQLLFHYPMANPSLMVKKKVFENMNQWYDNVFLGCADYEMCTRLAESYLLRNIPLILQKKREHETQITKSNKIIDDLHIIYKQNLNKLQIPPTASELKIHHEVTRSPSEAVTLAYLHSIDAWLTKIYRANTIHKAYPELELNNYLKEIWLKNMAGYTRLGVGFFKLFATSILSEYKSYSRWQRIKFWLKCCFRK